MQTKTNRPQYAGGQCWVRMALSITFELSAEDIFSYYPRRWSIEDLFNQMKNKWGWRETWQQSG